MPYRVLLHNDGFEESYALVKNERELRSAIHRMIEWKEDDWRSGDIIMIEKVTDVDAENEAFWEKLTSDMRASK